jgi:hypothetical protein
VAPATPGYDAFDSALLKPGGKGATTRALKCEFGDGQFSASVTLINEDRGSMGDAIRMLRGSISTNPVQVGITGSIQDANRTLPIDRTVTAQLAVNAWTALPIASGLRGPGRITLDATNESPHYTGVVVGVIRTATS